MNQSITFLTLILFLFPVTVTQAAEATPSDVYAQAVRIEHEVESLKHHFKISGDSRTESKSGDIKPRHNWAKSYILLLKLSKLRRKVGLAYVVPVYSEPMLEMSPNEPWEMTQRVLVEIAIIKQRLGIPGQPVPAVPVSGKRPVDVYNKLHRISGQLDLLTDATSPSEVYSEVKRLNEDANAVLRSLRVIENALPPQRRDNLQPKDSLRAVFEVLGEIQRIQRANGLQTMDFNGFEMGEKSRPDDVYGMVALALAELQRVKAQLGMIHLVTMPGVYEEKKTPADVVQLLGYITNKLRQVKSK